MKLTTYYRDGDDAQADLCLSRSGFYYVEYSYNEGTVVHTEQYPGEPVDKVRDILDDWALGIKGVNNG